MIRYLQNENCEIFINYEYEEDDNTLLKSLFQRCKNITVYIHLVSIQKSLFMLLFIKEAFLNNKSSKGMGNDYLTQKDNLHQKVLYAYDFINVYNQAKWLVVTEKSEEEIVKPTKQLLFKIIAITALLFIILLFVYFILLNRIIIKPIENLHNSLLDYFKFVNKETDSVKLIDIKSSDDEIGKLSEVINENIKKTEQIFEEEKKNNFIENGIIKLNSSLSKLNKSKEIFEYSLEFLCNYTKSEVGVFYRYEKENLKANNFYSFSPMSDFKEVYHLGEGIIGEVAKSQKFRLLTIPTDMKIDTTILNVEAEQTYISPVVFRNEIVGVIEIGKLSSFEEKELEFINGSVEIIAVALLTAINNEEVERLLEIAQKANEELEKEQQKLSQTNVLLEQKQQEVEEQNVELEEQKEELSEKIKELEIAKKEIEQSSKYKREFLANMSHELRTPLNSIILLSKLISENENIDNDDKQKAKVINKAGKELLLLINDILDLSKVEAGKMEMNEEEVSSEEIAQDIFNLFNETAKSKNLEFKVENNYKGTFISDALRLSQVIKNLLSNAFKFTKEGFVKFSIDKQNNNLIFKVSDSGIGIPADKLNTIFDEFKQVDGSITREFGGTGLGLSISKKIVDMMKGKIEVESEAGKGTTFRIVIPLKEVQKEIAKKPVEFSMREDNEVSNEEKPLKGKNILLVDDDSRNIFTLTAFLESIGAEVFSAFNGKEALESLAENDNIDIILLDLMMPVMDGITTIKKIKAHPKYKDITIIVITAKNMDEDKQECLKAGADEFLTKPVDTNALKSILLARIDK
jgi:signal transduction histidine kinase/ActR/RegA family two-component response regulator